MFDVEYLNQIYIFFRPKILVNDGNLVFQSAESKNVSIKLKGKSKFLVNDVDVLKFLMPTNASTSDSRSNSDSVSSLRAQVTKLKNAIRGQNGILKRLDDLESSQLINGTRVSTTDRSRVNALNRRISTLEQKVANLTERLMRDHCKSYPCQHGGTCFNMFDTYRCECTENWEGPTCSEDVNECSKYVGTDLGCQNGATCINIPGSYQ
jgi:cubilin